MNTENEANLKHESVELPVEFQEIVNDLPEGKKDSARNLLISVTSTMIDQRSHSGSLPSPQSIKAYDDVVKDGAERIFKMTETQSDHRIQMEKKIFTGDIRQSAIGQIFGFVVALIALYIAWDLANSEHEVVASIIGGTTVVGLVTVFVLGRKADKKNT